MPVRTTVLAVGAVASGGSRTVVYTCPAGQTAIIKFVAIFKSSGGAAGTVWIRAGPSGGVQPVILFTLNPGATANFMPWLVLHPGHQFELQDIGQSTLTFHLSGTELAGVEPAGTGLAQTLPVVPTIE